MSTNVYTVYTYLSVDIYECMSNVSITCSYRQCVLSPYISCYICICSSILSVVHSHSNRMYMKCCDVSYHNWVSMVTWVTAYSEGQVAASGGYGSSSRPFIRCRRTFFFEEKYSWFLHENKLSCYIFFVSMWYLKLQKSFIFQSQTFTFPRLHLAFRL